MSNKPAGQRNRDVNAKAWELCSNPIRGKSSLVTLGWKSSAAGCIFYSSYLLLNAKFESKMIINLYLRCLFGHKKVIVEILRSSFIGCLRFYLCFICPFVGGVVSFKEVKKSGHATKVMISVTGLTLRMKGIGAQFHTNRPDLASLSMLKILLTCTFQQKLNCTKCSNLCLK